MNTFAELGKSFLKLLLGKGSVRSFSQFGEDTIAATFFRGKKNGVYVDVGAYHPHLYSNTYLFYRRGWQGLVIDPNRALKTLFSVSRPRDTFSATGVGPAGSLRYYAYADGAYNTFDSNQVAEQKERKHLVPLEEYDVPLKPLSQLIEEAGLTHIDLLSVDVEGMDKEVLETHNWKLRPKVIIAEDRDFSLAAPEKSDVYVYLVGKGYTLTSIARLSLIFVDAS